MRWIVLLLVAFACLTLPESFAQDNSWNRLIDQDLSQWDRFLSYRYEVGYNGDQPVDEQGNPIPPIGLNQDSSNVFTVVDDDGESVLRISGEIYGCLVTKKQHANYHLQLKVKWGDKKWPPRQDMLRDTGVLYHGVGEMGADHWRSWMISQELQIMEGRTGDYWGQITTAMDIRAYPPEYIMTPIANESQSFIKMGEGESIEGYCLRKEDHLSPHGQWTTVDLVCFQGKSLHLVNGHLVMVLRNSRRREGEKMVPMTKGKLLLQSEGAEVFFKDIQIKSLNSLPEKWARHF